MHACVRASMSDIMSLRTTTGWTVNIFKLLNSPGTLSFISHSVKSKKNKVMVHGKNYFSIKRILLYTCN